MLRKITVTRNAFVCVEFIYPRPSETIIAFIDLWFWNLFTVQLMMAIGLYNTTQLPAGIITGSKCRGVRKGLQAIGHRLQRVIS
jgi:hypothetical protein